MQEVKKVYRTIRADAHAREERRRYLREYTLHRAKKEERSRLHIASFEEKALKTSWMGQTTILCILCFGKGLSQGTLYFVHLYNSALHFRFFDFIADNCGIGLR